MSWQPLGGSADFEEGRVREIRVGGRTLAVGRSAGEVFAVDDICPHAGASLAEGTLDDGFLICPLHGYAYDMRDGRCEEHPTPVATFPVRESDGKVEVDC